MREKSSFSEMYEDFQREACPHIAAIIHESIPKFWHYRWKADPNHAGVWMPSTGDHRARIKFRELHFVSHDKETGEGRPVGEQKAVQAVLLSRERPLPAGEAPFPSLREALAASQSYVDKTYEVGETWDHLETKSKTLGWDVSATLSSTTTIGNDATPAKEEIGLSVTTGAHGEESEGSSDGKGGHLLNSTTDHVPIPLGYRTRLQQTQRTGELEFDVRHHFEIDLVCDVIDWWERYKEGRFRDGPDHSKTGDRTRRILKIRSLDAFRLLMTGRDRRYEHVPDGFERWGKIKEHYRWLMDAANRTASVANVERYKHGFFDSGRVVHETL